MGKIESYKEEGDKYVPEQYMNPGAKDNFKEAVQELLQAAWRC